MNDDNLPSISIFDGTFDLSIIPRFPQTVEDRELEEMMYKNFFECALDIMSSGRSIAEIIRNDPRGIEYGRFLRWVRRSKARRKKYEEAQEIAAEVLVSEIPAIADGAVTLDQLPSTAERDNLRIRSRQWLAEKYNRRKYGQSKHLDVTGGGFDEATARKMSIDELEKLISENEGDEHADGPA